jgi:hypothetical protein
MPDHDGHSNHESNGTDQEHKKSLRRSWRTSGPVAKLTVIFSGIAAGATAVYAIAAIFQFIAMSGQLTEIKKGGADTHDLAVAAKKQAEKADTISTSITQAVEQLTASATAAREQAKSLQDQVDTIHRNFIKEQRPSLWFNDQDSVLSWNPEFGANWTFHYTNYGKSTAVNYRVDRRLEVGPDALRRVASDDVPSIPGKGTLPPGKVDYVTGADKEVSFAEFKEAEKHDNWIIFFGTFYYFDLAGNHYFVDFCQAGMGSGATGNCEYHPKRHKPN